MFKNRFIPFLILFLLGIASFLLPIREHDALRLRYLVGIWFFMEAAFLVAMGETRMTPLYRLVLRYPALRDKLVASLALAMFFCILYLAVWYLTENELVIAVKIAMAGGIVLVTWLAYYGICMLFGSRQLRDGILPRVLSRWAGGRKSTKERKSHQ